VFRTISGSSIRIGLEALSSDSAGYVAMGVQSIATGASSKMQQADIVIAFKNGSNPAVFDYRGPQSGNSYPAKDTSQDITLAVGGAVSDVFGIEVQLQPLLFVRTRTSRDTCSYSNSSHVRIRQLRTRHRTMIGLA
jgi:hypothetical protein